MNFAVIVLFIILILIIAVIGKNKTAHDDKITNLQQASNDKNEIEDMFFEKVSNGKEKIQFLKIDNQFDLMFIKSMFQSENIPYYVEFENISRMRPGMYIGDLGNYNLVYILEEDYDIGIKVVKKYIENKLKKAVNGKNTKKENLRNFTEVIFGNWKVPSANETHGIEIIYKKGN